MAKKEMSVFIPDEMVMNKIFLIRGLKVMLDSDLAELYQVETKALKQAVKRNLDIFPKHFMFELTEKEFQSLRSQNVTSKKTRGGTRYLPMVFTEYGLFQLANVTKSRRARLMSMRIIEVFVKIREMLIDNTELRLAIEKLERKSENSNKNIELLFQYVEELSEKKETEKEKPKRKLISKRRKLIGYKVVKKK